MAQWQLEWCNKYSQSLEKASSVAWGNQGCFQVSVIFLNFTLSPPPAPNRQWFLIDLRTRSKFLGLIAKSYSHLVSPQLLTLHLPLFFLSLIFHLGTYLLIFPNMKLLLTSVSLPMMPPYWIPCLVWLATPTGLSGLCPCCSSYDAFPPCCISLPCTYFFYCI